MKKEPITRNGKRCTTGPAIHVINQQEATRPDFIQAHSKTMVSLEAIDDEEIDRVVRLPG